MFFFFLQVNINCTYSLQLTSTEEKDHFLHFIPLFQIKRHNNSISAMVSRILIMFIINVS